MEINNKMEEKTEAAEMQMYRRTGRVPWMDKKTNKILNGRKLEDTEKEENANQTI